MIMFDQCRHQNEPTSTLFGFSKSASLLGRVRLMMGDVSLVKLFSSIFISIHKSLIHHRYQVAYNFIFGPSIGDVSWT